MLHLVRTDSNHPDFINLVKQLDTYLAHTDGDEHAFYAQYNKIDLLNEVVVAYNDGEAIGCGAIKPYPPSAMEIKRMYTSPSGRNKGVATNILKELEKWALELGYRRCILETGKRQAEAIALYHKCGYQITPNYGQYVGVENSVCFEKNLRNDRP